VSAAERVRLRARVEGLVQGVGFRPFVHRLAREHGLAGWVRNDERGVVLEVQGTAGPVELFLARLSSEAPPLAVVERIHRQALAPSWSEGFQILDSERGGEAAALVSADVAPCEDCLAELNDPADRRYRYPFINCTNCGPRFTIAHGVPYDRPLTTMSAFELCEECRAEYENPLSRRFHAQANACLACGPAARLLDGSGRRLGGEDPLAAAADLLRAGWIVAIKGLGGFHLACRADDERAVTELRRRKRREEKPFALMAAGLDAAEELVRLTASERELLGGRERPIVIAPRLPGAKVAEAVAPGLAELGVMLPSTPLHHLLLGGMSTALVMTSGNLGEEPVIHEDDDALRLLGTVAEAFLLHDRPIAAPVDDSVARVLSCGRPLMLRRSRGYAPGSIPLPLPTPPLLACGAERGSAFCLAKESRAWVSQHIGDLRNWQTLRFFGEGIEHFEALFAVRPEVVAHDLHPDYLSTGHALQRDGVSLIGVQHHHAHLAACLAEHGERGPAIGAIYDGAGLGSDGTIWGGELLVGGLESARRAGHLQTVALPGGDAAVRQPWRMACSWLLAAGGSESAPALPPGIAGRVDSERWEQVAELIRSGIASPMTSSMGRLFDAVAALCGIRMTVHDEALAAMELEAVAEPGELGAYPLAVLESDVVRLDPRETITAIVDDLARDVSPALVSARFHNSLADATARAVSLLARREDIRTVVLSGGVFQNRLLLERCIPALERTGLRVLIPRVLPPNDGSIAYGQAAVAAARLSA
jgi:hydrogenase maturation protein HypF